MKKTIIIATAAILLVSMLGSCMRSNHCAAYDRVEVKESK